MTVSFTTRLTATFDACKAEGRAALVTYFMAGDPDLETSLDLMRALPDAGADIIEFGMPFTDPMADGPAIQASAIRALAGGQTLRKTLDAVSRFRQTNENTPVVLMGYYNPIFIYGVEKFLTDAKAAGVDGLIIVDLPPETDDELCVPAMNHEINFIRLATPTTDAKRLPIVLQNTSGFVYYVSVAGITGTKKPDVSKVAEAVAAIKAQTDLPVAIGFGVREKSQAQELAGVADGVVVGSALVGALADSLENGKATDKTIPAVANIVADLRAGIEAARQTS